MKTIKFYTVIILIIAVLIIAFQNFASQVIFYFLLSQFTTQATIPFLLMAFMGILLGWVLRSYVQSIKDERRNRELEEEESTIPPTDETTTAETPENDDSDME
jgi:uncharacterized integral membrane protein